MKIDLKFVLISLSFSIALSCSNRINMNTQDINFNFSSPVDAENYVIKSEQNILDIRKGLEKTIIWADNNKKNKTDYSIIYIHGFTASRGEIAPVSDLIASELNANLFYTRLRGHGRTKDAFKTVVAEDWFADTIEAFEIGRAIGEKVIVIATSTGAPLTTYLINSEEYEKDIALVIWTSPNFGVADNALTP